MHEWERRGEESWCGGINRPSSPISSIISSAASARVFCISGSGSSLAVAATCLKRSPARSVQFPAPTSNPVSRSRSQKFVHLPSFERMKRSVQLALFLLLSFPVLSLARGGVKSFRPISSSVASICAHTPSPRLCMAASGRASNYPTANKVEVVLMANLRWILDQCTSAKKAALGLSQKARPKTASALKECASLYGNSLDLIGASTRAHTNNDQYEGALVKTMLAEVQQSAQQCNLLFERNGMPNPLAGYNTPLIKMTDVVNSINDRMNTRSH